MKKHFSPNDIFIRSQISTYDIRVPFVSETFDLNHFRDIIPGCSKDAGVFWRDEPYYYLDDRDKQYEFRFYLAVCGFDLYGYNDKDSKLVLDQNCHFEVLKFYDISSKREIETNLKEFVVTSPYSDYNLAEERLQRFYARGPKESYEQQLIKETYCKDMMFFEFTKDSAYAWGGPFTQDGKEGCAGMVRHNPKYKENITSTSFNLLNELSEYSMPSARKKDWPENSRLTLEEKTEIFKKS